MGTTAAAPNTPKGLVLSFPICKIDQERGEVWGFATTEALDQQGEIVDYEASKKAFAEWNQTFQEQSGGQSLGNLREMHQPRVVGHLIATQPDDGRKGIYVGARVNRETQDGKDAWNKVVNHELNGFSIGAPTAERVLEMKPTGAVRRVVGYKLAELSLVDNPACPESFFTEVKMTKGMLLPVEGAAPVEKAEALWSPKTDAERAWVSEKVKLLIGEGKPRDQAVAQAHSMGRDKFEGKAASAPHKENEMDANALAKQAEDIRKADELAKAGKKIGPQHHEVADPPGAQKPKLETIKAPENPPKPAKAAEAGGGIPSDDGATVSVPPGQGKAADVDPAGATIAPEHIDVPLPAGGGRKEGDMGPTSLQPGVDPVPARYGYCAYCGVKQADGMMPYHKECEARMKEASAKSAAAQDLLKAGNLGGLAKLFREQADAMEKAHGVIAAHAGEIEGLKKRIKTIEDQPTSGGPMRTELPAGVVAVEKGTAGNARLSMESALEKAMQATEDPNLRDQLSRELAKSMIRREQAK